MQELLVDTNILIRALVNDDSEQSPPSMDLLRKADAGEYTLVISPFVLNECTWVLHSNKNIKMPRKEVADFLLTFINSKGVKCQDKEVMEEVLKLHGEKNIDFVDALLAVQGKKTATPVVTWNEKDFKRTTAEYYNPTTISQNVDIFEI